MNCNKPIIAVDFDGTIIRSEYPNIANPNFVLIEYIKRYRKDYIWILWTCRHGKELEQALEWLEKEQGIVFDYINENVPWLIERFGDTRKVYADYYIDDKAINELKELGNGRS